VAVIGAAGVAVATGGFGSSSAPDRTTAGGGTTSSSAEPEAPEAAPTPSQSRRKAAAAPSAADGSAPVAGVDPLTRAVPRLRTSRLAADVQRAVDSERRAAVRRPAPTGKAAGCAPPTPRRGGRVIDVRLDGRPASLLVQAPVGGRQTATVYSCRGAGDPVAGTTVRVR